MEIGPHPQQILDGHPLLGFGCIGRLPLWIILGNGLVDSLDEPFVDGDPNQGAGKALFSRIDRKVAEVSLADVKQSVSFSTSFESPRYSISSRLIAEDSGNGKSDWKVCFSL
jgi:hypothetical protein